MRLLMLLPLVLAACAAAEPETDTCGALPLQDLVGQPADALAAYQFRGAMRLVPPDSAQTMDYNAERINIGLDDVGMITTISCG